MRKFWLPIGFALGALFVYALTHEARKLLRLNRERDEKMTAFRKETRMALARQGAIHGVDYLSDTFIEEELEKYKDVYEAWERGDFDEYPIWKPYVSPNLLLGYAVLLLPCTSMNHAVLATENSTNAPHRLEYAAHHLSTNRRVPHGRSCCF